MRTVLQMARRAFAAGGLAAATGTVSGPVAPTRPCRYSGATLEPPPVCCGDVFAFLFDIGGLRLLNVGSSNLDASAIKGTAFDLFLCGVGARRYRIGEITVK